MDGNGRVHTSSPRSPAGTVVPSSDQTSTAMPSAGPWISPACTGRVGSPPTKHPHRSVPPEIDARCRPSGDAAGATASATHSNDSGDSGEPVEASVRSDDRSAASAGRYPVCSTASRYFADTPRKVSDSSATRSQRRSGPGWNGLPSYSTVVAPDAGTVASQFHIIQPQVVK